jgi:hypothetical protein
MPGLKLGKSAVTLHRQVVTWIIGKVEHFGDYTVWIETVKDFFI